MAANQNVVDNIMEQDVDVPGAEGNPLFPVFLKPASLNILVVGAGKVGLEKLTALLNNAPDAKVRVVSSVVSDEVRSFVASYPQVAVQEKDYETTDLGDAEIIFIATNDKATSAFIRAEAKERNILVNVADTPELCDFYLGSIVQKGALKIGISTNGKSPTAAKRIKELLNDALPGELDELIQNLNKIRNKLTGDFDFKVKRLNKITGIMAAKSELEKEQKWKKIATFSVLVFAAILIGAFIFSYLPLQQIREDSFALLSSLDANFPWMVMAGFLAQLVDGALGMGYGVTSATILLSSGVSLPAISSSIHTAEMFASGASGYSHFKFGNVNKKLFRALVIPGVIGAIAGALLLGLYGDSHALWMKPILACYTLFLGLKIIYTAFRKIKKKNPFKKHGVLAGAGGFLDSFGGGGWGPIVTTTLIARGRNPKYVIGSVSLSEFFVTLASALTFFTILGVSQWQVIVALIIGGLTAAPIAARLAGKLPRKASLIMLGALVIIWSAKILLNVF